MIQLAFDQTATLRSWFLPDRPSQQVALHVIQTGNGTCYADRWPDPRAILMESGGNYALIGDPAALAPDDLQPLVKGFVDAPAHFEPLLRATFADMIVWPRIVFELTPPPQYTLPHGALVRRLNQADADHLHGLNLDIAWIAKTWGGPDGLAASGYAWGAFVEERLVAVACTFFVGNRYEEIGVVTEAAFRGLGLSGACAGALCEDIQRRGRRPSWSTSPDNIASLRVAEKLGFVLDRHDRLHVIGIPIPESAEPPRQ